MKYLLSVRNHWDQKFRTIGISESKQAAENAGKIMFPNADRIKVEAILNLDKEFKDCSLVGGDAERPEEICK